MPAAERTTCDEGLATVEWYKTASLPEATERSTASDTSVADSAGRPPKELSNPWLPLEKVPRGESVSARDTAEQQEMAATTAIATPVRTATKRSIKRVLSRCGRVGTNDRYLPDKGLGLVDEKRAKRTNGKPPEDPGIDDPGHERTTVGRGAVRGADKCGILERSTTFRLIPGLTRLVITSLVTVSPFW
jgi:hypothetical protein